MKLKQAMIASQASIFICLLVVLISGYYVFKSFQDYEKTNYLLNEYETVLNDTLNLEDEFFIYKDEAIADWTEEQMLDFRSTHNTLKRQFSDSPLAIVILDDIYAAVGQFEINLKRLLELQKKIGFSENEGLRGQFRRSAHALQALSNDLEDKQLELFLLELRRREKDYLIRRTEIYLEKHQTVISKTINHIEGMVQRKQEALNMLKNYQNAFEFLITASNEQGKSPNAGIRAKNLNQKATINERYATFSLLVNKEISESAYMGLLFALFVIIISPVIIIGFSLYINRRTTLGLIRFNQVFDNVVKSNDYSLRTDIEGGDEISHLSHQIDALLAHTERLIERLNEAQNRMIEDAKMASLGSMVSGFAHELNTPLGIAITSESVLRDQLQTVHKELKEGTLKKATLESLVGEAENALTLMESNLKRSASLVSNFKQVAAHQQYDEVVHFNFKELMGNLISNLSHEFERLDTYVDYDIPDNLFITSYMGAYNQLFTIFMINSLKHGKKIGQRLNIHVLVKVVQGKLHIRYEDDGIGIDEEILEKVFEPFITTKRSQGGTGLGLTIAYNLVSQKLNGEIEVQSIKGKGVCIFIHLPEERFEYDYPDKQEAK